MNEVPVSRVRGRIALIAVAFVVAAIALAVPLARAWSSRAAPSAPAGSAAPAGVPSILPGTGAPLGYAGTESWSAAVLDESDPVVLTVRAAVQGVSGYCVVTPVARVVSQGAARVTVAVAVYSARNPPSKTGDTPTACTDELRAAAVLTVRLDRPLGTRPLVDAEDGTIHAVLDPASVLKPGYLPAGYTGGEVSWGGEANRGGPPGPSATRAYQAPGSGLTITMYNGAPVGTPSTVLAHLTVRGHPAVAAYDAGFAADILISWNEDAGHAVSLYQMGHDDRQHPALTLSQLVQVANSLH
jgi:hypothetical protein